ncbi:MAG TPA: hypothetical protein VGR38_04660 [Candidatus Polarisedimenticolia bacterium]|nr:hypothetical protein [Candidatus Polarisedimenticolia bacterium]
MRPGTLRVAVGVPGFAVGIRDIELRKEQEEVTIPVSRGGTLRIRLPASMKRDQEGVRATKLRIEDSNGVELTEWMGSLDADRSWILFSDSGEAIITHAPLGWLKVRIGGEGTGFAQKQAEVELEEAGEAVADLR